MRGGNRKGAGRKSLADSQKRKSRNIYLTDECYEAILDAPLADATTFSQKCAVLIEKGLSSVDTFKNDTKLKVAESAQAYTVAPSLVTTTKTQLSATTSPLTFIDLFAGIGGIRKGFEDKTTRCVFSSEWDKFAAKTYEANFGELPHGDITQIDASAIPDHDVLLAGFPCQPFSNIGKREGFAHETQGTLFFDVLRILEQKKPKAFLLENVKGLLTSDYGRTFDVIINNLKGVGYSVFYKILDAQNFGLPQRRERIIIIGFRLDLNINEFDFPQGNTNARVPIGSILERDKDGYSISLRLQNSYLFKKDDGKPQLVDASSNCQVNTLCASYHKIQRLTGTFVKDGDTGIRMFSEQELKRLMGFPENFVVPVSRTQMYRQFGNSVAVPMIKAVAKVMKKVLNACNSQGEATKPNC